MVKLWVVEFVHYSLDLHLWMVIYLEEMLVQQLVGRNWMVVSLVDESMAYYWVFHLVQSMVIDILYP